MESLLKDLIVHRPEDPLKFLVERLKSVSPYRVVVLGPPGDLRKQVCLRLKEALNLEHLDTAKMISKEVEDNTPTGRNMRDKYTRRELVTDDHVGSIVVNKLKDCDVNIPEARLGSAKRGWLLDGFPRNRNQAFRIQSFGVIADKIFILDSTKAEACQKLIDRDVAKGKERAEADISAKRRTDEYFLNLEGIKRA